MRINAISAGGFSQTDDREAHAAAPTTGAKTDSRALVVIEPPKAAQDRPMAYRDVPFLAHLIATNTQVPQTRSRRRAEPRDALAAYRAVAKVVA